MPTRIREAIDRLYRKHPRAVAWAEGWLLLLLVVGGCLAIGIQVGMARADVRVASMSAAQQAELQRLMDINRQLMLIIEQRLPAIAEAASDAAATAERAAATAQAAARTAGSAGTTARSAATTAKQAASTAGAAARRVDEAVTPAPIEQPEAPAWLDTP